MNVTRPWIVRSAPAIAAFALTLLIWHGLSLLYPPHLFPGIGRSLAKIPEFAAEGVLWSSIWVTTWRTLYAYAFALLFGAVVGILMGYHRGFETLSKPFLYILQTISSIVWGFFSVIWFGFGHFSAIFVVFIVGFPILAFAFWEGVKAIDVDLEGMAHAFGVGRAEVLRGVTIPSLYPYLFAGVRSSYSYCWKIAIFAELLIGHQGIGYRLYFSWEQFRVTEVFAWVVVMIILMLLSEYVLIRPIERQVMRWRPQRA
ncbi:MAG: ABC transporter permease [Armatimonadetes bacterium]|nr:ABC transporter permease [Armatimonadota bacterium]